MRKPSELFGKRLKSVMDERGVTQTELAKTSGVAQPHISTYLKGGNAPSIDTLKALADGLTVPVTSLLGDTPPPAAKKPTTEEMTAFILERLGVDAPRLELIGFLLAADDRMVKNITTLLGPVMGKTALKKDKAASE